MRLDVVMLTKNSYSRLGRLLAQVVERAFEEIPVNDFYVIDGGSTDKTITILSRFPVKIYYGGNRAESREIAVDLVSTEFFVFLDDDALLCRGWLDKIMPEMDDTTGGVWGLTLPFGDIMKYYKLLSDFHGISILDLVERQGLRRGQTHDTLIRREAVEGLRIPKDLQYYEDEWIRRQIIANGYRWKVSRKAYCLHVRSMHGFDDGFKVGKLARKYGFESAGSALRGLVKPLLLFYRSLDASLAWKELKKQAGYMLGWLAP